MTNFNVRRALLCAAVSTLMAVAGQAPAMSVVVQDAPADGGDPPPPPPPPVDVVPISGDTSGVTPPGPYVVPISGDTSLVAGDGMGALRVQALDGQVAAVPEPATLTLTLTGLLLMAGLRLWRLRGDISASPR